MNRKAYTLLLWFTRWSYRSWCCQREPQHHHDKHNIVVVVIIIIMIVIAIVVITIITYYHHCYYCCCDYYCPGIWWWQKLHTDVSCRTPPHDNALAVLDSTHASRASMKTPSNCKRCATLASAHLSTKRTAFAHLHDEDFLVARGRLWQLQGYLHHPTHFSSYSSSPKPTTQCNCDSVNNHMYSLDIRQGHDKDIVTYVMTDNDLWAHDSNR